MIKLCFFLVVLSGVFSILVPGSALALEGAAQSELSWRATQFQESLQEFRKVSSGKAEIRVDLRRLESASEDLILSLRDQSTALTSIGQQVDRLIREMKTISQAVGDTRQWDEQRRSAWRQVIDSLQALQGQYASIRERSGERVSPAPLGRPQSDLADLETALLNVSKQAPRVVVRSPDRQAIDYLQTRVAFLRANEGLLSANRELYRIEMRRLGEDGEFVRAVLQRYPYDESLGSAWREARTILERLAGRVGPTPTQP